MASEDAEEEFGNYFEAGNEGVVVYENGVFISKDKQKRTTINQSEIIRSLVERLYPELEGRDKIDFNFIDWFG